MKLKFPVSRFPRQFDPSVHEMMDRADVDPALLKEDLYNIRRMNRWMGVHQIVASELEIFFSRWSARANGSSVLPSSSIQHPASKNFAILDLCTGSGDLPRVVVDWGRRRKIKIRITSTDINPRMLDEASLGSTDYPEIYFERADALNPPFSDGQYDLVMCNLALHHFSAEEAVRVLKQMWRLARGAILVNDLQRSRLISFFAQTVIPLFTANPITRFDAYVSTRRAFTDHEMLRLAFHAGIGEPQIRHYALGRQVMTAWKG